MREALVRCQNRVIEIMDAAVDKGTILLVDAEQTYINKALDSMTKQLQTHYHKDRPAFILNAYQSYLKASIDHVNLEIARCRRVNISCGIKLVRGAYMEEEREVAGSLNYESPVWDTVEETHKAYNTNISGILKNNEPGRDYTLVACHNVVSCEIAKEVIKDRGLGKDSVCFGQLKGFSDALTYSLADEGYNVLKYLPYGPTEFLIPYLIRRGNESKQVLREHLFLNDIIDEIKGRLTFK
jgi:proline dehydrogenase